VELTTWYLVAPPCLCNLGAKDQEEALNVCNSLENKRLTLMSVDVEDDAELDFV
jgi:hypothetical protein